MDNEILFLRDKDWAAIDGEVCRVTYFGALGTTVENGRVSALNKTLPYGAFAFECHALREVLPDVVELKGFVTHKLDFMHLWSAFNERGVGDDEEVLVIWSKKNLTRSARLMSKAMPRLVVWVCPKNAYELMTDKGYKPELTGLKRWEAMRPVAEWRPDVMQ